MSNQDTRDTGIPTRAIHEAYLGMQQSHRQYRQAHDDVGIDESPAHADFQDAVLTFYELIRPHIKRKSGMSKFWDGRLPDYPDRPWSSVDEAREYCRRYGIAVWGTQKHVQTAGSSPNADSGAANTRAITDGGRSLAEWHELLNLSDMQRIVKLEHENGVVTWVELRGVAGLKQLDSWDTRKKTRREQGDGFMAGQTATSVKLEYVPVWKLTKAKRLLAEAADKMNLLSSVDIDHEDGAIVNFDQSREGVEPEYRSADYDTSPDI